MRRIYQLAVVVIIVLSPLVFRQGIWAVHAGAQYLGDRVSQERELIKKTIEDYFDSRYKNHSTLRVEGLDKYVRKSDKGNGFLQAEKEKLEVEFHNAEINRLKYVDYKIFLDIQDITVDLAAQTASVSLLEGHDVVFEISAPKVSSLRNLKHTLSLEKEGSDWKIISDHYEDNLWRFIRQSKRSKGDLLNLIDQQEAIQNSPKQSTTADNSGNQQLSTSSTSYGEIPYNRDGAARYADDWAHGRNPDFYDFSDLGGDCTNFVSQAIHIGGGAPMVFGGTHGVGTKGWYYFSLHDRASAWTLVGGLYRFIVSDKNIWQGGPEGIEETNLYNMDKGDIVQFKWSASDPYWMHSVIIDGWENLGDGNKLYYVAGHSDDIKNYPLSSIQYFKRRFIRITRVEGYRSFLPLTISDGSSGSSANFTPP